MPISTEARELIELFSEAAKTHGWQEDMGYGPSVDEAKRMYEETKEALIQFIAKLEGR